MALREVFLPSIWVPLSVALRNAPHSALPQWYVYQNDKRAKLGELHTEECSFVYRKGALHRKLNISNGVKIRIFNTDVKSVLLYACESWKTTNQIARRLQIFVNKCLRRIMNIKWTDKITNEELWRITQQNLIFVVPCIMLNSEIIPTRCNNCVYSSQWLYSTCFG